MKSAKKFKKTPKHISDLPEEVLIKIFGYLTGNRRQSDLLNATLVNKEWNQIISESGRLMDLLTFRMRLNDKRNKTADVDVLKTIVLTKQYRHVIMEFDPFRFGFPIINEENGSSNGITKTFDWITSLNHLTTLTVCDVFFRPEYIALLSQCKLIKSLSFQGLNIEVTENWKSFEPAEFNNLRHLQIEPLSSALLRLIKCKQLDKFSALEEDNIGENVIEFLNQLERCNELVMSMPCEYWEGSNINPKFLWNKMKLCFAVDVEEYGINDVAIANIIELCQACSTHSEATIDFFCLGGGSFDKLWNAAFTCRKITKFILYGQLPTMITCNRFAHKMLDIRELVINSESVADQNFANFAVKLSNVTKLKIKHALDGGKLPDETQALLQPFFNQITELSIRNGYMIDFLPINHITTIRYENLKELTVEIEKSPCWTKVMNLELFCYRNPNLKHLNVKVKNYSEESLKLTFLHQQLHYTISSVNILIHDSYRRIYNNWRQLNAEMEIKIFGRQLNADENRFFV